VHGPATQSQNPDKTFFSCFRVDVRFFPVGTAIIQAVPAPRCAKIVGDQTAGYESADRKVIHYFLKFLLELYCLNSSVASAFPNLISLYEIILISCDDYFVNSLIFYIKEL